MTGSNTTMARFALCEKCHQQYANPGRPAFSCPAGGVSGSVGRGWLIHEHAARGNDGTRRDHGGGRAAGRAGRIVAIKGIGGFHLACRADSDAAVAELRRRKHRDAKPFAVMCADLDVVRRLVRISPEGERELTSPAAPIVLAPLISDLRSRDRSHVFAGTHRLGVMLPYTPLHHLLFAELERARWTALVMTSANVTR